MNRRCIAGLAALGLALAAGCYEQNERPTLTEIDGAADRPDASDGFEPDAAPSGDAGPDVDVDPDPPACTDDDECAPGYCAGDGTCQPAADGIDFPVEMDDLPRAGAARFDLLPDYLEPWHDAAGPDCPENRPGVFDGDRLTPTPDDPCRDGFDDLDGDGRFDAVWMAGAGLDRPARGIDEARPPEGRVVLFTRGGAVFVWVTLDVYALDAARGAALTERVSRRLGISPERIALHATGNRTGPDAVGLWGPSLSASGEPGARRLRDDLIDQRGLFAELPQQSGVDPAWFSALPGRIAAAVRQAAGEVGQISLREARAELPLQAPRYEGAIELPDADGDGVINDGADLAAWRTALPPIARDDRLPPSGDATLRLLALDAVDGGPRVLLASWSAAPDTLPAARALLDADYPGAVRDLLEQRFPGAVAVWLTGAAGDSFRAGGGARIPLELPDGAFAGPDGEPVDDPRVAAAADDPPAALGAMIVDRLLAALGEAPRQAADFELTQRYAWVPLTNPRMGLAARLDMLPHLRDWLRQRVPTDAWVDGQSVPGCGGLGCLRYRLDQITLGPLVLLTTPGALDRAYVDGRPEARLALGDGRNLTDLDNDGRPDDRDGELRLQVRTGGAELTIELPGPANPQRFPALSGLGRTGVWVIGRTNGGLGSLRTPEEALNPFEGQLDPLIALARRQPERTLCGSSHACAGGSTIGELVDRLWQAQPAVLADLPGSRELRLSEAVAAGGPFPWRIEDADGELRAEGDALYLGPRDRAFTEDADLVAAAVEPGDVLRVLDGVEEIEGDAAQPLRIAEVVPIEIRRHPNIGDAWRAIAPGGGDLVYNTACELLYAGPCPNRRPVVDDPNSGLPRTP